MQQIQKMYEEKQFDAIQDPRYVNHDMHKPPYL